MGKKKNAYPGVKIFKYAFLVIFSIVIIIPFYWLIASSLKNDGQFFAVPPVWVPDPPLWENYPFVLLELKYWRFIANSIWLGAAVVLLCVTSSSFVAYGFARFKFPGKNILFALLLSTMMLPVQVTMIPQFILFRHLGWLNTYLPLLVPHLFGSAYIIFLLRQFFAGIPREMDEAAKIDGCSSLLIWLWIILPQSKPALITSALFVFMYTYKDVMAPLLYLGNQSRYTVAVAVLLFTSPNYTNFSLQFVGVALALVPTVIFFIISQKFTDSGIQIASLK